MKLLLVFASVLAFTVASLVAGPFKSIFVTNTNKPFHVEDGEFMLIRNFTQTETGARSSVTFSRQGGDPVTVLTASIVDPTAPEGSQEVINSVILAGPGVVNFKCETSASCFATFKIDSN